MRRIAAGFATGIVLLAALPASASAAAWGVNDTVDTPVGQGCPSFANCSLREAVTSAEASPGDDAILVQAGTYPLTNGELTVTQDLSVSRVGAGATTVTGSNSSRIFDVSGSGTDFVLTSMTLTDGRVTGASSVAGGAILGGSGTTISVESSSITSSDVIATGSGASGGAIFTDGDLTLGTATGSQTGSVISGNTATSTGSTQGGAIATDSTVDQLGIGPRTVVTGNTATGAEARGGGIFSRDAASLVQAEISGNAAIGSSAMGGAIYLSRGTSTLTRTTISGNSATATSTSGADSIAFGGAIGIDFPAERDGRVEASFVTIAGNVATADSNATEQALGGAVATNQAASVGADNSFANSTIAGNSVSDPDGGEIGSAFYGGAINDFVLGGSIVAENLPVAPSQCSDATVVSNGYNLLGEISDCSYSPGTGDVTGVTDAGLTGLGDFGGLTQTKMLELGSPALDIIPAANALCTDATTDQRGISRPQSGNCDSGAVEARPATLTVTPDTRNFPAAAPGGSSNANVSISNGGDLAMSAAPNPSVASPFGYVSGCTSPVAAGGNCSMTLSFSPTAAGSFSETLTVTSGSLSDTATLNGSTPALPAAIDDTATVAEDVPPTAIDVLANDTDLAGATITSVDTTGTNGDVDITGGGTGVEYGPGSDYCNDPGAAPPDTFTYTITGGDTATVSVTVTCVEDDPVATNDVETVIEDSGTNTFNVRGNDIDADGGTMHITGVTQGSDGAVVITGGGDDLTYEPDPDYCNDQPSGPGSGPDDTFTYTLNGGSTGTVSVEVRCFLNPLSVTHFGDGSGRVTADVAGIDCRHNLAGPSDCNELIDDDVTVTLTATAEPGSTFAGWGPGGGCTGATQTCVRPMNATHIIPVTFERQGAPGPTDPGPSDPGPSDPDPADDVDRTAPETTITNRPKNLSPRHTRYRFRSSEPDSTYTCRLDDGELEPCNGGGIDLRNLDAGRHSFEVFATDAAGNADGSPATDRFRVRAKRRR